MFRVLQRLQVIVAIYADTDGPVLAHVSQRDSQSLPVKEPQFFARKPFFHGASCSLRLPSNVVNPTR